MSEFKALKPKQNEYQGLESIELDPSMIEVVYQSDELISSCPITGQPDMYTVAIRVLPDPGDARGLESKSLKLYLMTYRDGGIFCEDIAAKIAKDVAKVTHALTVEVAVEQKRRGGIAIVATAEVPGQIGN